MNEDIRDFSRSVRSPQYQHAPSKWPNNYPIFSLENECYYRAQEWNINETSSLQLSLTFVLSKKLEDLYMGTFVNGPGDDFPKQLNFKAKIANFNLTSYI